MQIDMSQIITAEDKAAEEQARRRAGIKVERERRLTAGAAFPVPGIADPLPLTGRPFDRSIYLGLMLRAQEYRVAGVSDPVLNIRTGDNVIHQLTPDQTISLVAQAMAWVEAVMSSSWEMIDSGNIPADFAADTHWP